MLDGFHALAKMPVAFHDIPGYVRSAKTPPGRLRRQKPAPVFGQRRGQRLPISYNDKEAGNKMQYLTKNERGFCEEMEERMEKTREQIMELLKKATLEQLYIIRKIIQEIIK